MLNLKQVHFTSLIQAGKMESLPDLRTVQLEIEEWYDEEAEKVIHQSKVDDVQMSEKARIHHHENHQKRIRNSSILKLTTERRMIEGHDVCSVFLQDTLEDLLSHPAKLDTISQAILLEGVTEVITDKDNEMLTSPVT